MRNTGLFLLATLACLFMGELIHAQRAGQEPHLAYAYPAGFQRGTTCEIVIGGQYLKTADEVFVAGEGVQAEVVGWYRPLTPGQYNDLRTKLRDTEEQLTAQGRQLPSDEELAKIAGITEDELREMEIYRQRERDPRRQPNDQLIEQKRLRVTVDKEAALGKRELRLLTDDAISNPLWVHIGTWPELRESEPNDIPPRSWEPENQIANLPVVINGQIMPGDVDCFSFEARQGMKLVIQVAAREVIPYLADAVPGWFQAVLRVTDQYGKEIRYADSFQYRQDPVAFFEVPQDGTYAIEVRDSLHRGREDFVYRITIGELPFVTSVFPLGARVDSELELQLSGWNLTQTMCSLQTMSRRQYRPLQQFAVAQGDAMLHIPLRIDKFPEIREQEPNDRIEQAQPIKIPVIINGRIDSPSDHDVFLIEGGGRVIAEVNARRLGSPLDSMIYLTDGQGNEIAFNDDFVDATQAMQTHHADSQLIARVPAQKTYLHITDAQQNGGPEFAYRLSLNAPQPDYELRVTPSSIMARAGQTVPITVFAMRHEGFREDIQVALVDPPAGFDLAGGVIPGSADQASMTLTMPRQTSTEPIILEMEGSAKQRSSGRAMVRPAIPAENMMQAFIWNTLVPVENWNVVVSKKQAAKLPFKVLMPAPRITLPSAGSFVLPVAPIAKDVRGDQLSLQVIEPSQGINAAIITNPMGAYAIELTVDEEQVERGLRGNLLMTLTREVMPEATSADSNEAAPTAKPWSTNYGLLPAIPFEISKQKSRRR